MWREAQMAEWPAIHVVLAGQGSAHRQPCLTLIDTDLCPRPAPCTARKRSERWASVFVWYRGECGEQVARTNWASGLSDQLLIHLVEALARNCSPVIGWDTIQTPDSVQLCRRLGKFPGTQSTCITSRPTNCRSSG